MLYTGKVFLLYRTFDCFKDKLSITTVIVIRSERQAFNHHCDLQQVSDLMKIAVVIESLSLKQSMGLYKRKTLPVYVFIKQCNTFFGFIIVHLLLNSIYLALLKVY